VAAGGAAVVVVIVGCLTNEGPAQNATGGETPIDRGAAAAADVSPVSLSRPTDNRSAIPLDRNVRVRLCGRNGTQGFSLSIKARCTITETATHQVLDSDAVFLAAQRVTPAPLARGITIGARTFEVDEISIAPHEDAAIGIDGATYRGMLMIRRDGSKLLVNNVIDLEAYLPAVLAGELPASFQPEAFEAMAVAARTYVLYQKRLYGGKRDFDVLPDERSQVYADWTRVTPRAVAAVRATRGEICTLPASEGGSIFCTYYSSCCGGRSQPIWNVRRDEPSVEPLGGGVVCDGCKRAPHYRWGELRLSKAEISRRVMERYPSLRKLGRVSRVELIDSTPDGRMIRLRLVGTSGAADTLGAEDFRLAVGGRQLKSTRCRMYDDGDGIVFYDGYGYGHGVGLCQFGANSLARSGADHLQILQHYFPGCQVRTCDQ